MLTAPQRVRLAKFQIEKQRWFIDSDFNFGPIICRENFSPAAVTSKNWQEFIQTNPLPNPPPPITVDQPWNQTPEVFKNQFRLAYASKIEFGQINILVHILKMKFQTVKIFILLMVVSAIVSGCASSEPTGFARGGPDVLLPQLTSVMTGPVGMLLTNGNTFSSEFSMTFAEDLEHPISGQILVRGGKIRLEAVFATKNKKSAVAGEFGLIWDEESNLGYVFSEALQGYAPLNNAVRYTNILAQVVTSPIDRMEGHPVDEANVTVMTSNGQTLVFQLVRVKDMGGLPMQTKSLNSLQAFTLTLSKIRLEKLPDDLFLPPEGFTKYESEAAMLTEFGIRQQGVFSAKRDAGINMDYKPHERSGQN